VGRPREHDDATRAALLDAAEALLARGGLDALSVRGVAAEAGTTTRAVYSLFGSKAGLLEGLAERTFGVLEAGLEGVRRSDDPLADLIAAGSEMYRDFVREHPWLYRITFQRVSPDLAFLPPTAEARARCWALLEARVARLPLHGRPVVDATVEFNAMCEGLANAELRGGTMRGADDGVWRDAITTVVHGLAAEPPRPRR
jgi:AcrR family transcriptional regulator